MSVVRPTAHRATGAIGRVSLSVSYDMTQDTLGTRLDFSNVVGMTRTMFTTMPATEIYFRGRVSVAHEP
jgi:hypothetical protein